LSTQNGKKTSVVGVVTAIYGPEWREKKDGTAYFGPGRIYLDVKGTTCEVSCWANEEIMPPFWNGINLDTIRGRNVVISATYDKQYKNPNSGETKDQYKNPTDIQYLDGDEPTQDAPEPTGEEDAPPPPVRHNIDPNQMRIMRQSTLHYASLLMVPLVKDYDHPQTMVERTIWLAGKLLQYVISGEMPFELEVEADEPEESPDLPSLGSV
jgi:hypothetical protein